MKTIREEYSNYFHCVYPNGAHPDQERHVKSAFYAGAITGTVNVLLAAKHLSSEEVGTYVQKFLDESTAHVWYQSAASGLWYQVKNAGGDISAVKVDGVIYKRQNAPPSGSPWIDAATKPTGWERKVLVWVVWPEYGWSSPPEPLIGCWKHGPGCFSIGHIENANHLVTHWMDIPKPNAT